MEKKRMIPVMRFGGGRLLGPYFLSLSFACAEERPRYEDFLGNISAKIWVFIPYYS